MARSKEKKKTEMIQVMVLPEDKQIFDAVCSARRTTMSEVLRQAMMQYLAANKEIVKEVSA